ncbi:kinase domain protein (macronuclear) [Tetrahymena thermophila SB210]|uniref:non-specific serine/threonine protein kinase n=1 Tax=Tetrahymena thermophila (strain SB210) TaxID=312017 RepID=I7MER9_TETTS|nr:kinase domain protein [Tetrahymena thermophila SB210]EAR97474.1 kinase domain protein [Tetrahymena thermophila SB210]|eukprot:XP_001017719.1 kinase domain protein [Tetrahymena thermophila SB210]
MDKYELQTLLSSSETADVHLCSTPKNTAIKIFKKEVAFKMELKSLTFLEKIPNVIKMKGFIDELPTQAIFLEYASNGTLFKFVANNNGLTEEGAHYFFKQIIKVVEILHSSQIVHRDIKLENILLDENYNAYLCDFGNAIFLKQIHDLEFIPSAGTQCCRAPELIRQKSDNLLVPRKPDAIDLKKADVFSLGVLLFTMVFCKQPFSKADSSDFFFQTLTKSKSKFWNLFAIEPSPLLKDLINQLIAPNPSDRLTIQEILSHQWIVQTESSVQNLKKASEKE